jgi:hypothetical protein
MWRHHYNYYVECDFCGQLTRGRVYESAKTKVRCGACDRCIASAVTLPDPPWINGEADDSADAQAPSPSKQDVDQDAPGGIEEHQDQAQGRDEDLAAQSALGKKEGDRRQG